MSSKDHDEDEPLPPPSAFDEVKDSGQIIRWLQKAMMEEENVEVTLNDRTRIFFTNFVDHLPELIPVPQPEGQAPPPEGTPAPETVQFTEPPYVPFSYLQGRTHLVISPLTPALGNVQIRSATEVIIRFFQGVKALEATVPFMSTVTVRGEPALQLGFPAAMRLFRKRRHFRARVTPEASVSLKLSAKGLPEQVFKVIDISVGGLAFCTAMTEEQLPIGTPVKVHLTAGTIPPVLVTAFVRNFARSSIKEGCQKGEYRCGLQFDVLSQHVGQAIEEMVTYVQREFLQEVQERKKGACVTAIAVKKTGLGDELGKLFGIKEKFRFS